MFNSAPFAAAGQRYKTPRVRAYCALDTEKLDGMDRVFPVHFSGFQQLCSFRFLVIISNI